MVVVDVLVGHARGDAVRQLPVHHLRQGMQAPAQHMLGAGFKNGQCEQAALPVDTVPSAGPDTWSARLEQLWPCLVLGRVPSQQLPPGLSRVGTVGQHPPYRDWTVAAAWPGCCRLHSRPCVCHACARSGICAPGACYDTVAGRRCVARTLRRLRSTKGTNSMGCA